MSRKCVMDTYVFDRASEQTQLLFEKWQSKVSEHNNFNAIHGIKTLFEFQLNFSLYRKCVDEMGDLHDQWKESAYNDGSLILEGEEW